MGKIYTKDACPEFVYKYCTKEIYDRFIRNGRFRFGTLASYRKAYETMGHEYGDSCEGNKTIIAENPRNYEINSTGSPSAMVFDLYVNAYIFSTALDYSESAHKSWYHREGCNYDICLKLHAKPFFKLLASKTRFHTPFGRELMLAKPIYNNGLSYSHSAKLSPENLFLVKSKGLSWESEYRLVCSPSNSSINGISINVTSLKAVNCIEEVITI